MGCFPFIHRQWLRYGIFNVDVAWCVAFILMRQTPRRYVEISWNNSPNEYVGRIEQREINTPKVISLYHGMTPHMSFGESLYNVRWYTRHEAFHYKTPFHRRKRDVVLHANNPIRGISWCCCWITLFAERMCAFHVDQINPTGEMCYIMGGVPFLPR